MKKTEIVRCRGPVATDRSSLIVVLEDEGTKEKGEGKGGAKEKEDGRGASKSPAKVRGNH